MSRGVSRIGNSYLCFGGGSDGMALQWDGGADDLTGIRGPEDPQGGAVGMHDEIEGGLCFACEEQNEGSKSWYPGAHASQARPARKISGSRVMGWSRAEIFWGECRSVSR